MSDSHGEHVTTGPSANHDTGVSPARAEHHGGHPAPANLPFTDADWEEFHKSDIGAGGAVVVLMTAIFGIGLVLYTVIAIVAWS